MLASADWYTTLFSSHFWPKLLFSVMSNSDDNPSKPPPAEFTIKLVPKVKSSQLTLTQMDRDNVNEQKNAKSRGKGKTKPITTANRSHTVATASLCRESVVRTVGEMKYERKRKVGDSSVGGPHKPKKTSANYRDKCHYSLDDNSEKELFKKFELGQPLDKLPKVFCDPHESEDVKLNSKGVKKVVAKDDTEECGSDDDDSTDFGSDKTIILDDMVHYENLKILADKYRVLIKDYYALQAENDKVVDTNKRLTKENKFLHNQMAVIHNASRRFTMAHINAELNEDK